MKPARQSVGGDGASGKTAFDADDLGLSLYQEPPQSELRVSEFEEFSLSRLKVLHTLDRTCGLEGHLGDISEVRPKILTDLVNAKLVLGQPTAGRADAFPHEKAEFCRRDVISHYALRLAFCKTREAREWFVRQEQRLFVLRFDQLNLPAKEAFLKASGVRCEKFVPGVDDAGKKFLEELKLATYGCKVWGERDGRKTFWFDETFYEMPFDEVHPNAIATRKVVLKKGIAYVPSSAMKFILASRFKERVIAGLDLAFQGLPTVLADPRVGDFLRLLQDHGLQLLVTSKSSSNEEAAERLSVDNFEELLARSFPPCMRRLVEKQRETKKHLKHMGRMQLRPFLKDCGFTLEESFKWWRTELCADREIDATTYEKNYVYDLEHAYGKKGHLQGQNCYGCPKIVGFPGESAGMVHGCPFKSLEPPAIKQMLHRWRIPEAAVAEVEKLVANGNHYQLACVEVFKAKHPGHEGDGVGNSPGSYYNESARFYLKKKEKEAERLAAKGEAKAAGAA